MNIKLLESIKRIDKRENIENSFYSKFKYSDSKYIDFLVDIFEGKEGKVQEIEKIHERYYRIKIEDEWYYLSHCLVIGYDFRSGKSVAFYKEKGQTTSGGHLKDLLSRNLGEEEVQILFEKIKYIFESYIASATKIAQDISNEILTTLHSFNHLSKISDNIYTLKRDVDNYTLVRSECYKNAALNYKFEIYKGDEKIKEFGGNSPVVNSLFKYLDFITEASATNLSEFNEISTIIQDLEL